ncbi:MAG: hypothetical protein JSS49_30460 [Planctomycetes bacterium]|nr:hypothetical protein [Planctomycetota bacterium]
MKTQSALPWFGSDSEVAPQLAAMLDHCKHVTIPFCGGLAILPYLKARAIVANDKHSHAINFYRQAAGHHGHEAREVLVEMCKRTLSHPSEMSRAVEILKVSNAGIDAAWAFWALCWLGRKGKGGTKHQGGLPSIRRTASGGTNASRVRAAADDLPAWATELERCEWESIDFREQLPKVAEHPECGIYADPPWRGPGRNYLHEFADTDHHDLALYLQRFHETTVVVRYGDDPLIRSLYQGWTIIEAEARNQANAVMGEIWITNRP